MGKKKRDGGERERHENNSMELTQASQPGADQEDPDEYPRITRGVGGYSLKLSRNPVRKIGPLKKKGLGKGEKDKSGTDIHRTVHIKPNFLRS